ncbi:CgeB family protein [Paenibacillus marinisediminis]
MRIPRGLTYRRRPPLTATRARRRRRIGLLEGYQEGYIRGRAASIVQLIRPEIPFRHIHVMYVSTGKGYPYSPLDEGMIATLRGMVAQVTTIGPKDAVAATAAQVRPDLVLALDGMELPVEQLNELRAIGIRTAIWLTDDPYYTDVMKNVVPHYDYIFTLEMNCVSFYQSIGCRNVNYLPFGVYPGHFQPRTTSSGRLREVCFIGTAYWNRVRFLDPIFSRLMSYDIRISGIWWDRAAGYGKYTHKVDLGRWLTPQETAEMYNKTKIVINMHRSHDDDTFNSNSAQVVGASPNPRTFEIMGCGTLQLTDVRSDLTRFYTPGVEIETYSSPEEMLQKIEHYLKHEEARREIALRGLARTLREHTYAHRLHQLFVTIYGS